MAVIDFGPLSPLYNVGWSHVVIYLVGYLSIVWWE